MLRRWNIYVDGPSGRAKWRFGHPLVTESGSLMPMPSPTRDGYVVVDAMHGLALVVSTGQRFPAASMGLTHLH